MGAHSHRHAVGAVDVGRVPRLVTLTALAVIGIATLVAGVLLWPDTGKAPHASPAGTFAAPGISFPHATILSTTPRCPPTTPSSAGYGQSAPVQTCDTLTARVDGSQTPVTVPLTPQWATAGLQAGMRIQLVRIPANGSATYAFFNLDRHVPLIWFAVIFAVVVIAVARLRGLMALIGLAAGAAVVGWFIIPALLQGESGAAVALTGATVIMFVVLYSTHGISLRTSVALFGTLVGLGLAAGVGAVMVSAATLTGWGDETAATLVGAASAVKLPDVLTCGLILAGLGVLNDVTVTQASAVWEIRSAGPHLSRTQVFASAMRIGRDHIASTIYTVVFAYTGATLAVLMLLRVYDQPIADLLSSDPIAEEIVRTLASAIGLVLAVPVTTAIAAAVAAPSPVRPTDHGI